MKINRRTLILLIVCLVFLVLWVWLQHTQQYIYFFREEHQLFLYDSSVFANRYIAIGGLALLLSQWLTQFFVEPLVGSAITAALCTGSAYALWRAIPYKNEAAWWLAPLTFMPVAMQISYLVDSRYHYDGLTALFLASLALWAWQALSRKLPRWSWLTATLLAAIVYLLSGPVAVVFVATTLVIDIVDKPRRMPLGFIAVIVVTALAVWAVTSAQLEDYHQALTYYFYYEAIDPPTVAYSSSWILMLIVVFIITLLGKWNPQRIAIKSSIAVTTTILAIIFTVKTEEHNRSSMLLYYRVQHDANTGQWGDILQCDDATQGNNYLLRNYVNLALSHEGQLMQRFFEYRQPHPMALCVAGGNSDSTPEVTTLYAQLDYHVGNVSSALDRAFDTFEMLQYGSPQMLKIMVKCNLILGNHSVAEKYINMLAKTWAYSDWAEQYRRFIGHPELVSHDPELGWQQRNLPKGINGERFIQMEVLFGDLLAIIKANPRNTIARDYAVAFAVVARQQNMVDELFDLLKSLPQSGEIPQMLTQAHDYFHQWDKNKTLEP